MLTISKPLSASQARRYHEEEFRNARENYYTDGDLIRDVWYGELAHRWSLAGEVREEYFGRLADGQHPMTGEQLVRHQTARETTNARGETVTTMEHRAGWDATFSAPKSVSITALGGGDERVREAHRGSVRVALNELEPYVQARLGGNRRPETTGNFVAALFEHDSARPVNGYAAPQLHTHAVIFNLTETADGTVRPLQPRELYRTQQYATAVYRSELAARLTALGYDIERGRSGQPEICGYTREYLDASSPRRQQIEEYLVEADRQGAQQRRLRRTRRGKPCWTCRMRRCSDGTWHSPSNLGTSREQSSRRPSTGTRTTSSSSVSRRMRHGGPSPSHAIAIWSETPSSRSAPSCAMPYSDHWAVHASSRSKGSSIGASIAANSSASSRNEAHQGGRSPHPR
jgi:conjugative relaxase-like TrwC/TraI family protein